MGEEAARAAGLEPEVVYRPESAPTSAADTVAAAATLAGAVDLILFAGGDGTARDILDAVGTGVPVLGIPTGVKMHSAVFAVNPRAAGEIAASFSGLRDAEVMDLDEDAVREGRVSARLYGHLRVPDVPVRIQQRKTGSSSVSPDAVAGIAAELVDSLAPGELLVLGPGTTMRSIAAVLGVDVPVMGVNVLRLTDNRTAGLVASDVSADRLLALVSATPARIAVTPIGGQGFLLGRGNQQLSPDVLRAVGPDRVLVVATEAKVAALRGRPLLIDTGDDGVDREFQRYLRVVTGRRRTLLYPTS
ncbi:ATP-NAD kinase [Solihabitans fulvus]|uniref:ATP-NAD kinase n=2 Tax=Solihabitans fulvus TaxID=1892852 RepID=A0A5B2XDP6_9PSEU|nr:ATP-NAD kinase [Solihabitans fulvus]